jgi:methylmalonyl-CoA decarboxylase subunit alpha
MPYEDLLKDLEVRKKKALEMGGKTKIEERRAAGFLNARERIDYLVDSGTFVEQGLLAAAIRDEVRDKSPADGKITGIGKINGRYTAIVSNDFTVLGASSSAVNMKKISHMRRVADQIGFPLILLGESTGARIPDRMGAAGRATMGADPHEYRRLRRIPMISALMGDCFGSSTWYTCLSDFRVMRKGAHMAVASPRVTSIAIGQEIDPEELGGWRLHSEISGLVDMVADSDEAVLDVIKTYLSYMPNNAEEAPPEVSVPSGSDDAAKTLLNIVPENRKRAYDMHRVIHAIVDKDSLFEFKKLFGPSLITALARLNGKTIGIIANNPSNKGGAIDVDAMRKATNFMVHCDSFNIPLVFLVDQPGFLIGFESEKRAAPGRIINWLNALSQCTVPKMTVIIRKSYGQAYLNMCGGRASDAVLLWPTAELGFMDPAVAIKILYNLREEDDPERFRLLQSDVERDTSAYDLARFYEGHMVIDPRDTRAELIKLLEIHRMGTTKGVGQHLLRNWPMNY